MNKTVIGLFKSRSQADKCVDEFKTKGIGDREISVVAREDRAGGGGAAGGELRSGVTTGAAVGGLAGILAGVGALAIPGVGPIVAAGPIATGLTGALTGGIAGGLLDLGIPQERGKFYEGRVREGDIVVAVRSDEKKVDEAAQILRRNGASDVETH
ncbi:MAG: hypothetical protein ACM3X4_04370 [Ignavibacteriales bacterium]